MEHEKIQSICMKSLTITDFQPQNNIKDNILKVGFDGENIYRSYMYFNIDDIPKNLIVNFVYLCIYLSGIDAVHSRETFYIQPLEEEFNEYTTFKNQPKYYNRQVRFEVNRKFKGLLRIDITSLFYEWNRDYVKNKGIIIKSGEKKKVMGSFISNFIYDYEFIPKLEIHISQLSHNNFQGILDVIEKCWDLEFYSVKYSPPINVERIIQGTFFVDNVGNNDIEAAVEVSSDLCNWIEDVKIEVNVNKSEVLIAKYYAKYYRVRFNCSKYGCVKLRFIYQVYK